MVKRTAQIFQRRIYDIASAIADPGPIAVQLFAERLIPEAVLNRATLNTIVAHERTSPLLDALMKALKTDYNEPAMFKKLCVVLMNFSETEAQGRGMYKEYCKCMCEEFNDTCGMWWGGAILIYFKLFNHHH